MTSYHRLIVIAVCVIGFVRIESSMALDPKLVATIATIVKALSSEEGQFDIQGRVIKYKAQGRVHSLKEPWVYDGTAWDVRSGTSEKAKHYKSAQGAIEHAVVKLMERLKRERKINDEF